MSKTLQEKINDTLRQRIDLEHFKTEYIETEIANTFGVHCIRKECPSSKGVYVELKQTRSADEAATKIYKCLECGTKWTVSG